MPNVCRLSTRDAAWFSLFRNKGEGYFLPFVFPLFFAMNYEYSIGVHLIASVFLFIYTFACKIVHFAKVLLYTFCQT